MRIAGRFGVEFVAATPPGYEPDPDVRRRRAEDARANGGSVEVIVDPREAVRGAQAVYTDVWTSMGQDEDREGRLQELEPYRIDDALLDLADSEAVAHALPARARRRGDQRRRCSTARAASRGSRPRTGCTRRRRSWPSSSDELRGSGSRGARRASAAHRLGARERRRRRRGREPRGTRSVRPLSRSPAARARRHGRSRSRTRSRSTGSRWRSPSPIPRSYGRRSGSPCCTSLRTTSGWTRIGSPSSATSEV